MLKLSKKNLFIIAAIFVAVILIVLGLINFYKADQAEEERQLESSQGNQESGLRHPLSGQAITQADFDFFPVSVMIDNGYDIPYSAGLDKAHIIYEALAESNITRLLAIFDSQVQATRIGPVRSARNYFMDWAEEYQGVYLHVGGSPQALGVIDDYDFVHIDQIGAGQIYFWRDENLDAPHNVFTAANNISRLKEWKQIATTTVDFLAWNFVDITDDISIEPPNLTVDFSSEHYQVDWKYNQTLKTYQRWRNQEKQISDNGEQLKADNIIIQVAPSTLLDAERRSIDTEAGGEVVIYNRFGKNTGTWKKIDNRTQFFKADNQEIDLVPGQTWVEIVDSLEQIKE